MGLGFTLGLILGGGLTPIILTAVASRAGMIGAASYIAAAAIVSAICGAVVTRRNKLVAAPEPAEAAKST